MAKKARRETKSKQEVQKFLANVPEEYVFWCCDGRLYRNMQELGDAFNTMTDETFAFHTNTEKSDFSNWVRDIIKDDKLARDLQKSVSRLQVAERVAERVTFLSSRLT